MAISTLENLLKNPDVRSGLTLDRLTLPTSRTKTVLRTLLSFAMRPANEPDFKPGIHATSDLFLLPQVHKEGDGTKMSPKELRAALSSQLDIARFYQGHQILLV